MATELSRSELYDLVWTHPRTVLAKRFGVSDVAIGDACQTANIPMPPRGYWAKKSAGNSPPPRPALPRRDFAQSATIELGPRSEWRPPEKEDDIPEPPKPHFDETLSEVETRAKAAVMRAPTYKDLQKPHELMLRKVLTVDRRRATQAAKEGWTHTVAPLEQRKRVILNNLIWALAPLGYTFNFGVDVGEFRVQVGRTLHTLKFAWANSALRLEIDPHAYGPSVYPVLTWGDGKESIEKQTKDIAAHLLVSAEVAYRHAQQAHYDWAIQRRKELREAPARKAAIEAQLLREKVEGAEKLRRERLYQLAASYAKAREIRMFIEAAPDAPALTEWKAWALKQADILDPLTLPVESLAF